MYGVSLPFLTLVRWRSDAYTRASSYNLDSGNNLPFIYPGYLCNVIGLSTRFSPSGGSSSRVNLPPAPDRDVQLCQHDQSNEKSKEQAPIVRQTSQVTPKGSENPTKAET